MSFKNPFNLSKSAIVSPQEKKQRFLILILGIVLICIAGVFYFGFLREKPSSGELPEEDGSFNKNAFEQTQEMIDFDTSFFNNSEFKELKTYGEWPIKIEDTGKENPFGSY